MPELMISPMLDLIFLLLAFFIISTMYMTEVRTISIALPTAQNAVSYTHLTLPTNSLV